MNPGINQRGTAGNQLENRVDQILKAVTVGDVNRKLPGMTSKTVT